MKREITAGQALVNKLQRSLKVTDPSENHPLKLIERL